MTLETILEILRPVLEAYLGELGLFMQIVTIIGSARIIFKPLMTLLETIAEQTETPVDNEWLESFKDSKVYTVIIFIIDYILSIKKPVIDAVRNNEDS